MKKKLMLLVAMLAMMMLAAAPVLAQVGNEFDDQELESGDIETETSLSIEGNNNQYVGALQFARPELLQLAGYFTVRYR